LVVLDRLPSGDLPRIELRGLTAVIQAAFGQRRKTLVNALSAGLDLPRGKVAEAVEKRGLPAGVRAERLTPGQFVVLAAELPMEAEANTLSGEVGAAEPGPT